MEQWSAVGLRPRPSRPGYLVPNSAEESLINLALDSYLELGSFEGTISSLNSQGYRTKSYTSRRGRHHPGKKFNISSLRYLLKNVSYIGKKEIVQVDELGEKRYLVDAVWPPIVTEQKFQVVQQLMTDNAHHSGVSSLQHVYTLSGLVFCKRCGTKMDGESATGRLGTKYFYYRCSNRDCKLRVAAGEVEEAIVDRLQQVADDRELLNRLTAETNRKLQQSKPKLERQKAGLEKDLKEIQQTAERLILELTAMGHGTGQGFIREKLNDLGQRRSDLEYGLAAVQQELDSLDREVVDVDLVRAL